MGGHISRKLVMEKLHELSIPELRARCQSNAPEAGRDPIIGHSIRFFSIYFTKVFLRLETTPFMVTVYSVLLFLLGCTLFIFDRYTWNLAGVLLMYTSIVLDGCNGEVARLKKYRPDIGSIYIEPVSHDIQYALMFLPMAVGVYLKTGSVLIVFVAFVATIAKLLQRFFITRYCQLILSEMKKVDTEGEAVIPFNPDVPLYHKMYRWVNRNLLSSVGLVIPLFFTVLIDRVDLFVFAFAFIYSAFAILHFGKEVNHIVKIDVPMEKMEVKTGVTAVILAGGKGTRLGTLTQETLKPLIQVNGRSLLSYGVAWAKSAGAKKIVIAGSHHIDQIRRAAHHIDPSIVVVKDEIEKPGNRLLGLLAAESEIEGDAIVFDGDYIFHGDIADELMRHSYDAVTVHASRDRSSYTAQDVIISYDQENRLKSLWKTDGTQAIEDQQAYFNSLLYIPASELDSFLDLGRRLFSEKQADPVHIEDAVLAYVAKGHMVKTAFFRKALWMEVDTLAELEAAQSFVRRYSDRLP